MDKTYIAIDLKSFYASVECVERDLDPLTTNLVVADAARTEKTICLAVTPSLKSYGVSGRARLFEVIQSVREENVKRLKIIGKNEFDGKSIHRYELDENPRLGIDYIAAPPRMALYMDYSNRIYKIYLKYVAPEDIHVYSVDEVFIDVTHYLSTSGLTAHAFTKKIIQDIYLSLGITATAGIGTNLYLCKIAMDIVAKHIPADEDGVRIAYLDEMTYRKQLWNHKPITDFWRVGKGYKKRLEEHAIYTMGDIARCSMGGDNDYYNEDLLYRLFGVNAELLIDHAWGYEPCSIKDIKSYKPSNKSTGAGQVLHAPYTFELARIVVQEMTDLLVLDLVEKNLLTDQVVLTVGYDISNLSDAKVAGRYKGEVKTDYYGRKVPKHARGSANIKKMTSSTKLIMDAVVKLYDDIVNPDLFVRRISLVANHVVDADDYQMEDHYEQLDLFTDYKVKDQEEEAEKEALEKEKHLQDAIITLKKKFGKNAVLKGMNLQKGATTKERNKQIGGHKA